MYFVLLIHIDVMLLEQPMKNSLSIRSYNKTLTGHDHSYVQLVLPLQGVLSICLHGKDHYKVQPGHCMIINAHVSHHFTADEQARFMVADLILLPENLQSFKTPLFTIDQPLARYLQFYEAQLEHPLSSGVEQHILQLFLALLAQQRELVALDTRIQQVQNHIQNHLSEALSIAQLANIACLSETQFKKLFSEQTGQTPMRYITDLRMSRARSLLINTDYPVQIVAEKVGYQDLSAFSRRFRTTYGLTPRAIKH